MKQSKQYTYYKNSKSNNYFKLDVDIVNVHTLKLCSPKCILQTTKMSFFSIFLGVQVVLACPYQTVLKKNLKTEKKKLSKQS